MKRAKLIISGKVQRVSFRFHVKKAAQKHNLKGYVKNIPDGKVEVVSEGEESNLKKLISECRRGSFLARVDKVDVSFEEPTGEFEDFLIEF